MSDPETAVSADADPTTPAGGPASRNGSGAGARWLLAVAVALAAFNLRPAVTSLGALLEDVRTDLGMSATVAGLLTAMPSLCFAAFGVAAPALARRIGPMAAVGAGTAAITLGLAARVVAGGTAVFLLLSAVALAGIAVSNILMPVVVKRFFPDRIEIGRAHV